MTGAVWAQRPDGLRIGVVPFGEGHPSAAMRGRWHVLILPPGREVPQALSAPMSEGAAREHARDLWASLPLYPRRTLGELVDGAGDLGEAGPG